MLSRALECVMVTVLEFVIVGALEFLMDRAWEFVTVKDRNLQRLGHWNLGIKT